MAGFGSSHGDINYLIIVHFPEKYDIRTLAQSCAQSQYIVIGIYTDLTLADDTFGVVWLM